MIARPSRTISVGTTATLLSDITKMPVAYRDIRYETGGGTIALGKVGVTTATGETITAGTNFRDIDQSNERYAVASAGTISVSVTDYEA